MLLHIQAIAVGMDMENESIDLQKDVFTCDQYSRSVNNTGTTTSW